MRSAKRDADKMICIFSFPPLKFLRNIPWEIFGGEILSTYNLRDHIPEMKTKNNLEKIFLSEEEEMSTQMLKLVYMQEEI